MKTFIPGTLGLAGFAFGTGYRRAPRASVTRNGKQHLTERARAMQGRTFFLLGAALAACDVQEGPPLYSNPPPAPLADVQTGLGQPHTDCPSGHTIC